MKSLSLRYLGMLVFLLLCCVACTDHEPQQPQVVLPVIKTVAATSSPPTYDPVFRLEIESLGNVGITEYGIAYLLAPDGSNPADYTPLATGTKAIFNPPATVGVHTKPAPFTDAQVEVFYYRAYAILQNGMTVYGEVYGAD